MGFLPSYRSPLFQIILVGLVCFCCPGMFNALNGLGAGGKIADTTAASANTALYACMGVTGFVAGAVHNLLGPRLTMALGGSTYILYVGAFLSYNHSESPTFAIVAGALLGVGAALLWTAQGVIMMAYPTSTEKGKFIGIFWIIFNLGGVLGGFIPFILNYNNSGHKGVNDWTYIAFMIIMGLGALMSLVLASPNTVVRTDGTKVEFEKQESSWKQEVKGIVKSFGDPTLLLLSPMFLASNWFYSYQFDGVNAALFDTPTRGLNDALYWGAQMFGAYFFGKMLDSESFIKSRRKRAVVSLVLMTLFSTAIWGGGLALQLQYSRRDPHKNWSFKDSSVVWGPIILYLCYGALDAVFQTWCYWIMGAKTSDPKTLARYAGWYKSVQSIGGAISWGINAGGLDFIWQLVIVWGIMTVSFPPALLVAARLKNEDEENELEK